jgi:hypothetical protein
MGAPDPQLAASGKHEFRLGRLFAAYAKNDAPPMRVKPVPIQIIQHALTLANSVPSADNLAVANMILIAFFFLMRPGEHTVTKDNTPFKLKDIQFHVGQNRYNAATIPLGLLPAASFILCDLHLRYTKKCPTQRSHWTWSQWSGQLLSRRSYSTTRLTPPRQQCPSKHPSGDLLLTQWLF